MNITSEITTHSDPLQVLKDGITFHRRLPLPRILKWRIRKALDAKTLDKDMAFVIEPEKDVFMFVRSRHVGFSYKDPNGSPKRWIMQGSEQDIRKLLHLLLE
jgi:hypothetical protein